MDSEAHVNPDPRRQIPSVDALCREVGRDHSELPDWARLLATREVIEGARDALEKLLSRGGKPSEIRQILDIDWTETVAGRAARIAAPHPRRVINATGVVLHTNLGRAPLAEGAAQAAAEAATHYSDLEFDLASGQRGNRLASLSRKLQAISGAEAALAVNNNAAAVLLALDTLARGREVIVSRGELVEIGGSFRIPAIMERAGVRLVEVGTTNRTHPADYTAAIGPDTALLLKVHRSNFEQSGFVAEVELAELVEIAHAAGLPVVEDLGAGVLGGWHAPGFPSESEVRSRLDLGADLVCFSGDKLLGGPQAGIALGSTKVIEGMRTNPLARALRLDKMTLAALDWTLDALLEGREREIPALRCLLEDPGVLEARAARLRRLLEEIQELDIDLRIEGDRVPVGGGSLPGFDLESVRIALRRRAKGPSPSRIAERMREAPVPVIVRLRDDTVLLDLRTLSDDELPDVADAVRLAFR